MEIICSDSPFIHSSQNFWGAHATTISTEEQNIPEVLLAKRI